MGLEEDVAALKQTVQDLIVQQRNTPRIGSITLMSVDDDPMEGYLLCDGTEYDMLKPENAIYKLLFDKIKNNYGGDGINTFKVPDPRGEFLRFFDKGRGVDAGRTIGSAQEAGTAMPNNPFVNQGVGDHNHTIHGVGDHAHGGFVGTVNVGSHDDGNKNVCPDGRAPNPAAGAHTHGLDAAGSHNHTLSGGDPETRPRNVTFVAYIRY